MSHWEKYRPLVSQFVLVVFAVIIFLVYYGNQRKLEYDWIVSPGAKPEAIRFTVDGARRIKVDSKGDLVLAVAGGDVCLHKPVVYQETDGVRHEIAGGYVIGSNREVGFRIPEYDLTKPLLIEQRVRENLPFHIPEIAQPAERDAPRG
jgi:hypothetical protein